MFSTTFSKSKKLEIFRSNIENVKTVATTTFCALCARHGGNPRYRFQGRPDQGRRRDNQHQRQAVARHRGHVRGGENTRPQFRRRQQVLRRRGVVQARIDRRRRLARLRRVLVTEQTERRVRHQPGAGQQNEQTLVSVADRARHEHRVRGGRVLQGRRP